MKRLFHALLCVLCVPAFAVHAQRPDTARQDLRWFQDAKLGIVIGLQLVVRGHLSTHP